MTATQMRWRRLEIAILARLKVPNPYIAQRPKG